jgi:hypothetical protein
VQVDQGEVSVSFAKKAAESDPWPEGLLVTGHRDEIPDSRMVEKNGQHGLGGDHVKGPAVFAVPIIKDTRGQDHVSEMAQADDEKLFVGHGKFRSANILDFRGSFCFSKYNKHAEMTDFLLEEILAL